MDSKEAKLRAVEWIAKQGSDLAIKPIYEDETYFVFAWNTRAYLENGDDMSCLLGPGPTVLDKRDGNIVGYGSGVGYHLSTQQLLERHDQNRRDQLEKENIVHQHFPNFNAEKPYRLAIHQVFKKTRLAEVLFKMKVRYVIPELSGGIIWRQSQAYNLELLNSRLEQPLPIFFLHAVSLNQLVLLIKADDQEKLAEFSIEEYAFIRKPYLPSKAQSSDYDPEW